MSRYFSLTLDCRHLTPIRPIMHPLGPQLKPQMTQKESMLLGKAAVGYYNPKEGTITDILLSPSFLISDEIKKTIEIYQDKAYFKAIQLYNVTVEEGFGGNSYKNPLYWLGIYPNVSCLSEESEFNPNGTIKHMVLDKYKLPDCAVFESNEILEKKVIIRLDLAESILRRSLLGIALEEIEVR